MAIMRLLSMMLKHVHFEVFLCFEGDIALNTRVPFDHFHFHCESSATVVQCRKEESWGVTEERKNQNGVFLKSESDICLQSKSQEQKPRIL